MLHKVFVYGTLKQGQPNHSLLGQASKGGFQRLLGIGKTSNKYPLVIASRYNIPYILDHRGQGQHVLGEVYSVDELMLNNLDKLENAPAYYTRCLDPIEMVEVTNKDDDDLKPKQITHCFIYVLQNFKRELLKLPCIDNYCPTESDKPYVTREQRDPQVGTRYYEDVKEEQL